jgi:hypothetical protein
MFAYEELYSYHRWCINKAYLHTFAVLGTPCLQVSRQETVTVISPLAVRKCADPHGRRQQN